MIGGGFAGVLTLSVLGGGLIAPASPGSIFAELLMTPKGAYIPNLLGIIAGGVVSFVLSIGLLKVFGKDDADLDAAQEKIKASKAASKNISVDQVKTAWDMKASEPGVNSGEAVVSITVRKIVFACDAGMGSSAMGATKLRKKLLAAGITEITVIHSPVSEVPSDADVIVCHRELGGRAKEANSKARLVTITDFLNAPEYEELIVSLKK
jgi:PTS system mannitol-specific IIC component